MALNSPKKSNIPKYLQQHSSMSQIANIQIHTKENPIPPNIRTLEAKGFIAYRSKVYQQTARELALNQCVALLVSYDMIIPFDRSLLHGLINIYKCEFSPYKHVVVTKKFNILFYCFGMNISSDNVL